MSRKKRVEKPEIEKEADYYKLKTEAVKNLVEADETNSPVVSEEELRKYRSGGKIKLSQWMKYLLIKAWFAGSVCFFFLWGLGGYLADMLDTVVVTGIALGIVTDLLTNNVLRFFEKEKGEADRWIMVTRRGYISFPLNILYAFVVLILVMLFYNTVNTVCAAVTGVNDRVFFGVEPVCFGIITMGIDLLLIQIKNRLGRAIHKTGNKI